MFSPMVPEKRKGSCNTTAKWRRSAVKIVIAQITPSNKMRPAVTS
jgi:hypothetical protein